MNRTLFNFNTLLGFSALFIAGCAAFFSIWGIGLLFSGASIAAMIMASSLELGKLVATSFLYRFWKRSQWLLKSYLCVSVMILMCITSLGIFGYLSSAYQQSSVKYTLLQDQISTLESQKKQSLVKVDDVKKRIDSLSVLRKTQEDRLSQVNTNTLLARNPIQFRQVQEQTMELIDQTDKNIKDENEKTKQYSNEIDSIDKKLSDIKLNSAETKDIQTFKFVAEAFGVSLNTVAKWFIFVLICVFDPLAVALVLAYNVATNREYEIYKNETENPQPAPKIDVVPTTNLQPQTVPVDQPQVTSNDIKPTETSVSEQPSVENVVPNVQSSNIIESSNSLNRVNLMTGNKVHS